MNRERESAIEETLYWEEKRRQNAERLNANNMMKFNPSFFRGNNNILREKSTFLNGGNW